MAQAIDRGLLDGWVVESSPRALAYATSLLGDRSEAEDIVQDCFCRLLARADCYDLPRDGFRLLLRSVSNACINHRTRRRPTRDIAEGGLGLVDRSTPDPASLAVGRELESRIGLGLASLPVAQRAAIELKSLGHSLDEIGRILEVTDAHAGVLVHRGRKAMASYLAPYLGDPQ